MTTPLPSASEPGLDPWRALDPLTRLVVAVATLVAALVVSGPLCLGALAVVAVLLPAALARVLRTTVVTSLALALPLGVSAVLVNLLFAPGSTAEGARLALAVVARILTMAGATVLFYRTTRPSQLVASLEHHGLSRSAAFLVHNAVAMLPQLARRAGEVSDAQRARGLDTEGNPWRRARGLSALAVPTVLGAIGEVEARALALESRGFTRPGRPTLLWVPPDSRLQRVFRWGLLAILAAVVALRLLGGWTC